MLPRNNCSHEGLMGLSVLWGDLWKFAFLMVISRTEVADVVYEQDVLFLAYLGFCFS